MPAISSLASLASHLPGPSRSYGHAPPTMTPLPLSRQRQGQDVEWTGASLSERTPVGDTDTLCRATQTMRTGSCNENGGSYGRSASGSRSHRRSLEILCFATLAAPQAKLPSSYVSKLARSTARSSPARKDYNVWDRHWLLNQPGKPE